MKHQYTESDIIRGKAIQYYRRQAGLTQAELAMMMKVSSVREYEWEKGAKPSVKNWHKLCQILKMPLEWLDEDFSDPINSRRMQTAFLRRLIFLRRTSRSWKKPLTVITKQRNRYRRHVTVAKVNINRKNSSVAGNCYGRNR